MALKYCFLASMMALASHGTTITTNFLVMADWGGRIITPYTTPEEVASANIMSKIAEMYNVTAAAGIGDNMYLLGVKNEFDPRFQETFEDCFDQESLSNLPFYMVAGNHDHYGNVTGEIYYTNYSSRWIFPDYYYSVTFDIGNGKTFQLVFIDTVILTGQTEDIEYCQEMNIPLNKCKIHPNGPENQKLADAQLTWLENILNNSVADYLFVAGHYPVYSIAEHGSTKELVEQLIPLFQQYQVNGYLSGHDHTFEYIIDPDEPDIVYVDTGGTHTCNPSTKHENTIPKDSLLFHGCDNGGFTRYEFQTTENNIQQLVVYFYFGSGTDIQYTTDNINPRNGDYLAKKRHELNLSTQPLGIVTSTK